ncbi:TPA: DUF4815 domain-containing protein [Salmonella enterica subsp. enterica serovar Newport]
MAKTIDQLVKDGDGYYDRSQLGAKAGTYYDKHMFIAGRILQSAELNEVQSTGQYQLKSIADALFKDGDIVRDCRAVINSTTKVATIESGAIYLAGQVRGVPDGSMTVPATGSLSIGIWLESIVINENDPEGTDFKDPSTGTRGFNQPGAMRLVKTPTWGLSTDTKAANFEYFPVYYVDDGELRAKEPPPNLDAVTQAIARYDVDSNGSNYVVSGFRVMSMPDENGAQVYSINAGRARVNGFGIQQNSARRQTLTPVIPTLEIDAQTSQVLTLAQAKADANSGVYKPDDPSNAGKQWVTVPQALTPLHALLRLNILKPFDPATSGGVTRVVGVDNDTIPASYGTFETISKITDNSDGTGAGTYVQGTDYEYLKNQKVIHWKTANRPAERSTYYVFGNSWLRYNVPAEDIHDKGFYVKGAVIDPAVTTSADYDFEFRLPRVDRLVVDETGSYHWIIGIATNGVPISPPVPSNVLSLCQVIQSWNRDDGNGTTIVNDGVRMVSMTELESMNSRLDNLTDMIAQVNLISDINVREAGVKKGVFVDPFINDDQRDQGLDSNKTPLAIAGGCLQLAIDATPCTPAPEPNSGITGVVGIMSCQPVDELVLSNEYRTTEMKVNPYMAFGAFPGTATLTPQIDRWVKTQTRLIATDTRYFTTIVYAPWSFTGGVHGTTQQTGQVITQEFVSSSTAEDEYLQERDVAFTISGFRPGENLTQLLFDDVDIIGTVTA